MSPLPTSRRFVTELLNALPAKEKSADDANPLSGVEDAAKKQLLALQVLFPNEFLPALDLLDRGLVTRLRVVNGEGKNAVDDGQQHPRADAHGIDHAEAGPTAQQDYEEMVSAESTPAIQLHTSLHDTSHSVDQTITDAPAEESTITPLTSSDTIYYVRSAQQRSSRYSTSYDTTISYEVRLLAWNCSCPAFAFAAFPAVHPEPAIPVYEPNNKGDLRFTNTSEPSWVFGGVSLGDAMPPVCKHLLACVLVEKCSGLFGGFVEDKVVSVAEAAGWAAGWGD